MPGILTCFGGSVPRNAMRLTWAMTMPPARRAACAIENHLTEDRLVLHGDVAVFIGRSAAHQGNIDVERT